MNCHHPPSQSLSIFKALISDVARWEVLTTNVHSCGMICSIFAWISPHLVWNPTCLVWNYTILWYFIQSWYEIERVVWLHTVVWNTESMVWNSTFTTLVHTTVWNLTSMVWNKHESQKRMMSYKGMKCRYHGMKWTLLGMKSLLWYETRSVGTQP